MTLRNTFDKVAVDVWQLHEDKIEQIFSLNIYLNLNKSLIIMKLNKGFQTSILNKKIFLSSWTHKYITSITALSCCRHDTNVQLSELTALMAMGLPLFND